LKGDNEAAEQNNLTERHGFAYRSITEKKRGMTVLPPQFYQFPCNARSRQLLFQLAFSQVRR